MDKKAQINPYSNAMPFVFSTGFFMRHYKPIVKFL